MRHDDLIARLDREVGAGWNDGIAQLLADCRAALASLPTAEPVEWQVRHQLGSGPCPWSNCSKETYEKTKRAIADGWSWEARALFAAPVSNPQARVVGWPGTMDLIHAAFAETGSAQGTPVNKAFVQGARWVRRQMVEAEDRAAQAQRAPITAEWVARMAKLEDGHEVDVGAQAGPSAPLEIPPPEQVAATHPAMEAAARWIEARRDAYVNEHGIYDPDTGGTDFPGDGAEYVQELDEIAEGLRAAVPPPEQDDGKAELTPVTALPSDTELLDWLVCHPRKIMCIEDGVFFWRANTESPFHQEDNLRTAIINAKAAMEAE